MRLAVFFLTVALIAAFFGFSGLTGIVEDIGKVVFSAFAVFFLAAFIIGQLTAEIMEQDRL